MHIAALNGVPELSCLEKVEVLTKLVKEIGVTYTVFQQRGDTVNYSAGSQFTDHCTTLGTCWSGIYHQTNAAYR